MPLSLYRRHRQECKAAYPHDFRSSEYDERRKGWKRCECPIFASGTLNRRFKRHNTGQWEFEAAHAVAAALERAGSWVVAIEPVAPVSSSEEPRTARTSVEDAAEAFVAKCKNRNIAPNTLAKYRTFTNQLLAYCLDRGCVYIDQLTVNDMDRFYATWKDAIRSKAKKLERLKAFIKFSVKREWLTKDIADDLEAPEGASVTVPKTPFTDEELERLYAACDEIGPQLKQGPGCRTWGGEDAKDFIYLSIYTGPRISDAATFDISKRLTGNDVFLRMHKTKRPLFTWIPDWLVERLRARQRIHGPLIFAAGVTRNAKQLCDIWRNKRLKKVFELAGPWESPPHPHKFRHTFVRILLEKGVPVPDVAELIGDSEQILRKHYAAWIPGRQDRISRILKKAFSDQPKGKVAKVVSIR
ncbi:MAG: tyrosine-type recombinase/integrase [Terracidiphilus sp.]